MDELQLERQQMQTELSRLADVCRNESVPDAFQTFVAGIPTLTKTERRIFDGYAAGLRTREIAQQLAIKDSTLRFHNKNIYDKLGVSSLKQLRQHPGRKRPQEGPLNGTFPRRRFHRKQAKMKGLAGLSIALTRMPYIIMAAITEPLFLHLGAISTSPVPRTISRRSEAVLIFFIAGTPILHLPK